MKKLFGWGGVLINLGTIAGEVSGVIPNGTSAHVALVAGTFLAGLGKLFEDVSGA